jgi:hypothetical protein
MPLQIRRGTTAQRLAITPLTGELIHDTTTGQLFVGNGATAGGVTTTGISLEDAADAAASLFTTGSHSGITFAYNDAAGRIDATVTVAATGPFDGDLTGSVFSDGSTLLVDGTNGRLVGPLATSGLAANLNVNGFSIVSSSNGDIIIAPNGTGTIEMNGDITKTGELIISPTTRTVFGNSSAGIDGNIVITRNTAGATSGFIFQQHHATADANNFLFYRTRGTALTPTVVLNGDDLGDIVFSGHDGTNAVASASFSVVVDGVPTLNNIPTKFTFLTNNGSSTAVRAELSSAGIWRANSISAFTTNSDLAISGNGTGNVNIESVKISGSTISTTDSSSIIVSQASTFSSNLTVDGTLTVTDSIVQNNTNNNYVTATLQTQGSARIVEGVHYGSYTQLVTNTPETYTTISYNSTIYKGCRATFKVHQATNVYISEVLLVNTTTAVTIVTAQDTAASIGANIVGSITADYNSATGSIRLRPVTSASITSGLNYFWTVSYQLFT